MIPGNPGIIQFYDTFLGELYRLLDKKVEITGLSHPNHFLDSNGEVYSLTEQILQKVLYLRQEI